MSNLFWKIVGLFCPKRISSESLSSGRKRKQEESKKIMEKIGLFLNRKYGEKHEFKFEDSIVNKVFFNAIYKNSKDKRMIEVSYNRDNKEIKECNYTEKELKDRRRKVAEIVGKIYQYTEEKYKNKYTPYNIIDIEEDNNKYSVVYSSNKDVRELKVSFNKKVGNIEENYIN